MWTRTESLQTLNSIINSKLDIYTYKLARYFNKINVDLRNYTEFDWSFNTSFSSFLQDSDLLQSGSSNVIKSVIDSLVSKLANNKTRPYFTPVNGTYETRQIVKSAQTYFDTFYDNANIHAKIAKAFKEACIFDIGYIFINPFTWAIDVADTWTVAILSTEKSTPTKLLIRIENYPTTLIDKTLNEKYVQYAIYIDVIEHKAIEYINAKISKEISYNAETLPIVPVYFNEPVNGNQTISVVDELDGIQTQIDLISAKISTAAQLTPANVTYVYENSSLKAGDVSNRTGTVYSIDMPPGTTTLPVQNVTPAPFDPQWLSLLDYYKGLAYEMIGISQLSAQSKKPSGLNSGTALQTMEDIESDRFETQVAHYINAYVNLAKTIIAVAPENATILPEDTNTSNVKWKDVKKQSGLFKVQYSAASSLSKDPAEKIKQIMQMSQVGLIPPSKIANYLNMPDLQDAFIGASAVQDAIDTVISNAIEKDEFVIPEFVNYQQLSQEIALVQNQLFSCLDNKKAREAISKLNKLDETLNQIMIENGYIDLTPNEQTEESSVGGEDNGGLGIGSQQTATQAISGADAINPSAIPQTENVDMTGGNEDIANI